MKIDRFDVQDASIVIVAESHNPTILNPDFLKRPENAIVPEEWELATPPVCAFPLAQVVFENGLTITAEPNRLIFAEGNAESLPGESEFARVSARYVSKLPHVRYTAVGCNFTLRREADSLAEAAEAVSSRFLKPGPWNRFAGPSELIAEVKLSFILSDARLTLTVSPAELDDRGQKKFVENLQANFHVDVTGEDRCSRVVEAIESWRVRLSQLEEVVVGLYEEVSN